MTRPIKKTFAQKKEFKALNPSCVAFNSGFQSLLEERTSASRLRGAIKVVVDGQELLRGVRTPTSEMLGWKLWNLRNLLIRRANNQEFHLPCSEKVLAHYKAIISYAE